MKEQLTVVIPCKNEKHNIYECVSFLAKQKDITGTKVIIADSSDEDDSIWWINKTINEFKYSLNISSIPGGYPAKARLEGSKLATTPYILFLDSDIMLFEKDLLYKIFNKMKDKKLATVTFSTDPSWNFIFRLFNIFQSLSIVLGTPFAVGGFQLWETKKYWAVGGYEADQMFAEDYYLSSRVSRREFYVYKTNLVHTSPRRFKKKGIKYMFWIMIKSYLNRNNPKFFKHHHNYWS
jgi:glycosyltransferase involved in cell wall biosynthesis